MSIYRIFTAGNRPTVLQIRGLDGEVLAVGDLNPFCALRPLTMPGGTLPLGSLLLLAGDAAERMLAVASIEPLAEVPEMIFAGGAQPGGSLGCTGDGIGPQA